jgi:hypothetical protein
VFFSVTLPATSADAAIQGASIDVSFCWSATAA